MSSPGGFRTPSSEDFSLFSTEPIMCCENWIPESMKGRQILLWPQDSVVSNPCLHLSQLPGLRVSPKLRSRALAAVVGAGLGSAQCSFVRALMLPPHLTHHQTDVQYICPHMFDAWYILQMNKLHLSRVMGVGGLGGMRYYGYLDTLVNSEFPWMLCIPNFLKQSI